MGSHCDCFCHTSSFASCDMIGGCGCGQHRAGTCLTCPVLRPDSKAREPHTPPVCDGDRRLLNRWLGEISNLIADLSQPEEPVLDQRRSERWTRDHQGRLRYRGVMYNDPLTAVGGVAPINSRTNQPAVTGSRERPIPINTTALDLTADRRVHNLTDQAWPEDQIGHLSAATVLDEWVRDIRDLTAPDHHLPEPTTDGMVMWLRVRLDLTCDGYPHIAEYAESLRNLRGALRAAAGETEPRPQHCEGVACPRCDLRTLATTPGDDYHAQCGNCETLLTDDEYTAAVEAQGKKQRDQRAPDEIHKLLRRV